MATRKHLRARAPLETPSDSPDASNGSDLTSSPRRNSRGNDLRAEQVEFVIWARDNNKPDPYGTVSTTTGPLTWNEVAQLYQVQFGLGSRAAAMEKRYRMNKEKYYTANPAYPRVITYAPKQQQQQGDAKTSKPTARRGGYGVLNPPDSVRNRADLNLYFPEPEIADSDPDSDWYTFYVYNHVYDIEETVDVPLHHISRSSGWYGEFLSPTQRLVIDFPKLTVERFVQCISPERVAILPEFDMIIVRDMLPDGNTVSHHAQCTRIVWTFRELLDLYILASTFGDDHVRNLVFDHWRNICLQKVEWEVFESDLHRLFSFTESNNPAKLFWACAIAAMSWEYVMVHDDPLPGELLAIIQEMSDRPTPPCELSDDDFCTTFHRHGSEQNFCTLTDHHETANDCDIDFQLIACRLKRAATRDLGVSHGLGSVEEIARELERQHHTLTVDEAVDLLSS